jgi:hypothetical protein
LHTVSLSFSENSAINLQKRTQNCKQKMDRFQRTGNQNAHKNVAFETERIYLLEHCCLIFEQWV